MIGGGVSPAQQVFSFPDTNRNPELSVPDQSGLEFADMRHQNHIAFHQHSNESPINQKANFSNIHHMMNDCDGQSAKIFPRSMKLEASGSDVKPIAGSLRITDNSGKSSNLAKVSANHASQKASPFRVPDHNSGEANRSNDTHISAPSENGKRRQNSHTPTHLKQSPTNDGFEAGSTHVNGPEIYAGPDRDDTFGPIPTDSIKPLHQVVQANLTNTGRVGGNAVGPNSVQNGTQILCKVCGDKAR